MFASVFYKTNFDYFRGKKFRRQKFFWLSKPQNICILWTTFAVYTFFWTLKYKKVLR